MEKTSSKDIALSKIPPQNTEVEEALLGALLLDPLALPEVIEALDPSDFYRSAHQKIFAAMIRLFEKNEPLDVILLSNFLAEQNQLDQVGGAIYLSRLFDQATVAVNVIHYAKLLKDKSSLRQLIEKSTEIAKKCFEDAGNVDELLDFSEHSIFEITQQKLQNVYLPLGKLINTTIDTLHSRKGRTSLVSGVETAFVDLDRMTAGLQPSDLVILAARPSMGKTALALNIATNAAIRAQIPVASAIFSLEMSKEQLALRMLCSEAEVDASKLRNGFLSKEDWGNITDAASRLIEAPIFIDDSPTISALELRAKARRLKMEKNIGLIIVDYLQLMKGSSSERRELEISEISRSLKGLAKELNVPVLALSQLNRKLEDRGDKRPILSDLRESGALEQDADVVLFIYRDEVYNKEENNPNRGTAEIHVRKQRNGPTGDFKMLFSGRYTRFDNLRVI